MCDKLYLSEEEQVNIATIRNSPKTDQSTISYWIIWLVKSVKSLNKFGNVLTFRGRDYLEKIRMDRVELLYYVHQQRRQAFLQPALELLTTGNNKN
jgi:hypothetical protein